MRVAIASAFSAALLIGGPSHAQKNAAPAAPPASVTEMMGCRAMTDSAARLACYDRAVGNLQQAVAAREVVIVSAEDVRKTRRSLFGFTVPKLPFFGGDDDDTPETKEIITKVAGARSLGYGKWQIRLEDGATWETTEGFREGDIPGVGDSIRITKGALGNYFMSVSGSKSVRARRLS